LIIAERRDLETERLSCVVADVRQLIESYTLTKAIKSGSQAHGNKRNCFLALGATREPSTLQESDFVRKAMLGVGDRVNATLRYLQARSKDLILTSRH